MTQENVVQSQTTTDQHHADAIKNLLFDSFFTHFKATCDQVRKLPVQQNLKDIILRELDNALLWTKEAISSININPPADQDSEAKPAAA